MNSFVRLLLSAPIDFAVGGQAVIEGVMMRSPHFYTVSVRDPQGNLQMRQAPFKSLLERFPILKWPLIRGVVQLVESMMIGFRALNYSNDVFSGIEEKEHTGWRKWAWTAFGIAYTLLSLSFTLFLLKFLPLWVAEKASEIWPVVDQHYMLFNAIDGSTKIAIFLAYLGLISLLQDIRRVFQYHGAEHKSIWAYEHHLPLTVENARKQSRFHPRCGTSFIFIVILMSVFVYTAIPPAEHFWGMLAERLAVIPLIAGISYELLKFSAKHQKNPLVRFLVAPGLFLQKITTREPDDAQLEVALHSLKASLEVERLPVL